MKNLFLILLLTLLASCGSGSGGSSVGAGEITPPIPFDPMDEISEYRLIVTGVQGTAFASVAYKDFGLSSQDQVSWTQTIGVEGTNDIAIFGQSAYWQVQKTGGGDLNLRITKDGVEVANVTITQDGVTEILTEGI